MISSQVKRTLVKSPPELWTELSDPAALARHLGEFGEIRITRAKPEELLEWESEHASGRVELKPSGWGTKVTLSVTGELSAPSPREPGATAEPAPPPLSASPPPAPAPSPASGLEPAPSPAPAPSLAPDPVPAPAPAAVEAHAEPAPSTRAIEPESRQPTPPQPESREPPQPESREPEPELREPESREPEPREPEPRKPAPEPRDELIPPPQSAAAIAAESAGVAASASGLGGPTEPAVDHPSESRRQGTAATSQETRRNPEPKRGFFARLFGRGAAPSEAQGAGLPASPAAAMPVEEPISIPLPPPAPSHREEAPIEQLAPHREHPLSAAREQQPEQEQDEEPRLSEPAPLSPGQPAPGVTTAAEPLANPHAEAVPAEPPGGNPAESASPTPSKSPSPAPVSGVESLSEELNAREETAEEQVKMVLTSVLDRLGSAHHRPFSRS